MPIEYRIDHDRRIVLAKGRGTFTGQDIFGYQREAWSRPDVAGYNELVDMSAVEQIVFSGDSRMRELADLSAGTDTAAAGAKFAIVAPQELAFGLGRMYAAYRELNPQTTKQIRVFRSMAEALEWLGITLHDEVG